LQVVEHDRRPWVGQSVFVFQSVLNVEAAHVKMLAVELESDGSDVGLTTT
jgi:hypothetical protein